MLRKYAAYKGARIQRIDHINCFTPDVQASYDFYTDIGFRLTEYTETDGDDAKLWAVWMHRKGNVHDLAFTNGTRPAPASHRRLDRRPARHSAYLRRDGLVRLSAEYGTRARAGTAFPTRSFSISAIPTATGSNCSPRIISPSIPISNRCAGRCTDPQRQTLWGHPAPKSWFEEGSHFVGVPLREPALAAQPIVAR